MLGFFIYFLGSVILTMALALTQQASESAKSQGLVRNATLTQGGQTNTLELVRAEYIATMRVNKLNDASLIAGLRCALKNAAASGSCPGAPAWATPLVVDHTPAGGVPQQLVVRTTKVPDEDDTIRYADVLIRELTPGQANRLPSSRAARIRLGESSIFRNVLTGHNLGCVFCHATLYGNVAEYSDNTHHVTWHTRVHGNWFSGGDDLTGGFAKHLDCTTASSCESVISSTGKTGWGAWGLPVTADVDDDDNTPADFFGIDQKKPSFNTYLPPASMFMFMKNSAVQPSDQAFTPNYEGPSLPWNAQRQEKMLPKFDPTSMLILATGTVTGGKIYSVPYGADDTTTPVSETKLDGIVEGNVIIDGRDKSNPVVINGRIFVRGDVVIMGWISGKGEIYSGRNIYIPDDLEYLNPPPQFDGSLASNTAMADVGKPAQAKALAVAMAPYDQLSLFATNNIVVNDPFPLDSTGEVGGDARYIQNLNLLGYDGLIAQEASTGFALDAVVQGGGTVCYMRPWSRPGSCIPDDAAHLTKFTLRKYPTPTSPGADDKKYYRDETVANYSDALKSFLLPQNMVNGTPKAWITQANFYSYTANTAERDHAKSQPFIAADPTDRRRARFKTFRIVTPGDHPMDPSTWNSDAFAAEIEAKTGLLSEMAGAKVRNKDEAETLATDRFRDFWKLVKVASIGKSKETAVEAGFENWQDPGFNGSDRTNYQLYAGPDGKRPLFKRFYPQTSRTTNLVSYFSYDRDVAENATQPTWKGRTTIEIHRWEGRDVLGYIAEPTETSTVCSDAYAFKGWDSSMSTATGLLGDPPVYTCQRRLSQAVGAAPMPINDDPSAGLTPYKVAAPGNKPSLATEMFREWWGYGRTGAPAYGSVFPGATGTTYPTPWQYPYNGHTAKSPEAVMVPKPYELMRDPNDPRYKNNDDIFVEYHSRNASLLIETRYWDPNKLRPWNRIKKVQSFLFANQFAFFMNDSDSDRQIRVYGGIVAKDLGGKFLNSMGPDRSYSDPDGVFQHQAAVGQNMTGLTPGIIMYYDPRVLGNLSLIYDDFARVYYTE